MEEESQRVSAPSSSSSYVVQVHEQTQIEQDHQVHQLPRVRPNFTFSDTRNDVWSCLIVLVTFWFFASMTLILGFYGSAGLELGPNCSRLEQANSIFVHSIQAQEIEGSKPGPMLYGFYEPPPLDVEVTWSETHNVSVETNFHKEWIYFLNKGSQVDVSYSVENPDSLPLSLVITQGRESLVEWVEDPSYPNTTLSWNIIHGSGKIQQEIFKASNYYIAVGNLNSEDVQIQLNLTIKALLYDTSNAYSKCYLSNNICRVTLALMGTHVAVLTSPGPEEDTLEDDWYVNVSYGAQWLTYFAGSGVMIVIFLLAFNCWDKYQATSEAGGVGTEHDPLLSPKDDDVSSWGSSYDCISHDDDDLDEWLAVNDIEGKLLKDGENNNPRRLCVICYDALRDCFFLPCGHCATCFTCGTRIAEEDGNCPICLRKMKKVRKIFTV